jgi:HPt (histidine-containing phosphotransfer) domain-containing protein
MRRAFPPLLLLLLAACPRPDAAPRVDAEEARAAARMACATSHLLARAQEDLETLAGALPEAPDGAATRTTGPAAVLAFSRAYQQHAELSAARFAHVDSALNAARTLEDSARYDERARAFRISRPEQETLEGNVATAYQRNLEALLTDPEHPCNRG